MTPLHEVSQKCHLIKTFKQKKAIQNGWPLNIICLPITQATYLILKLPYALALDYCEHKFQS
jgi:hypothetical protein